MAGTDARVALAAQPDRETANNSDDSPADGIESDHTDQHECEHHEGCAALPVAVSPCDHNPGNAY
jgi:hypothetical protein